MLALGAFIALTMVSMIFVSLAVYVIMTGVEGRRSLGWSLIQGVILLGIAIVPLFVAGILIGENLLTVH